MKKKILIVEDDPAAQKILSRMIRKIDASTHVYGVDSAEAAYRTLESAVHEGEPFDLVLADLNLPGSDGLLLQEIADKRGLATEFLFISGVTYEEWHKRSALHRNMPPLLRKPVTEDQLRIYWEDHFTKPGYCAG